MNVKKVLRRVWWFVWEDNSIWSWIVNIILAFVLIKFVVYPGLGLVLGTTHPVVAVVSSSMEHPGGFEQWFTTKQCTTADGRRVSQEEIFKQNGIFLDDFNQFAFKHGFNKGDIMIIVGPEDLRVGDVLVFNADHRLDPIIHRVVRVKEANGEKLYSTKGDNNCASAKFEKDIGPDKMIGKALFRIPLLGWLKIGFVELLRVLGVVG